MKKLIYFSCIFLLYGCIFTYDPKHGSLYVKNNSDEIIYVYLKCGKADSLPIEPKLELFHYISAKMENAKGDTIKPCFISPEYRINTNTQGSLTIWGTVKNPRLPCDQNEVTLFFITENTMKKYSWNEIVRKQLYEKKLVFTEKQMEENNWKIIYR